MKLDNKYINLKTGIVIRKWQDGGKFCITVWSLHSHGTGLGSDLMLSYENKDERDKAFDGMVIEASS